MLKPANDAPERKMTWAGVRFKIFRIVSVTSNPSTVNKPRLTACRRKPWNQTPTRAAREMRDFTKPFVVDGPSSKPTTLGGSASLAERTRNVGE